MSEYNKYEQAKVVIYASGTSIEKYLIDIIEKQRDVALTQFRRIEDCIYEPDKITIHIDHGRKDITKLTEE